MAMFGQRWTIASKFFDYFSPTVERDLLLFFAVQLTCGIFLDDRVIYDHISAVFIKTTRDPEYGNMAFCSTDIIKTQKE